MYVLFMVVLLALSNMADLICSRKYKNMIDDIGSHCSSGWPRTLHLLYSFGNTDVSSNA